MLRIFLAGLMSIASMPAVAGDAAELEILGFNADGSIFAFEEYGIQDGSGFAYATRYFIDMATDSFVSGTPVRVMLEEDGLSVEDARKAAMEQSQSIVPDAVLRENRGRLAGFNAISEMSADPHRMEVNPRPVFPPIDASLSLRLEEIGFQPPELCEGLTQRHVGFRLVQVATVPGEPAKLLHEDESIPESRSCPEGYRIGAVQTFFPKAGPPVFVVMIAVRRLGFEGPDHRWIAVPGTL